MTITIDQPTTTTVTLVTIDKDRALELLTDVVDEAGRGHIYEGPSRGAGPRCVYAYNGQPDCIVGPGRTPGTLGARCSTPRTPTRTRSEFR